MRLVPGQLRRWRIVASIEEHNRVFMLLRSVAAHAQFGATRWQVFPAPFESSVDQFFACTILDCSEAL